MVPQAPQPAPPVQPTAPLPPVVPAQPPVTPPVQPVLAPQPSEAPAEWTRERILQPINEAAVLVDRAAAEEAIAHPVTTTDPADQYPRQSLDVPLTPAIPSAAEIARAPDNVPVPAQETTVQDFLPPVLDKNGNIDNKVNYDSVSWQRLLMAGLVLPFAWLLAEYWLSSAVTGIIRSQSTNDFMAFTRMYEDWGWLLSAMPFIAVIVVSVLGYFILRYPHRGYRALLAVGVTFFMVGLIQLAPYVPAISDITTSTVMVTTALMNPVMLFQNSTGVGEIWATVALVIAAGIVGALVVYGVLRLLRFKVPGAVVVIAMIIVSFVPVGVTIPMVVEKRQQQEAALEELRSNLESIRGESSL